MRVNNWDYRYSELEPLFRLGGIIHGGGGGVGVDGCWIDSFNPFPKAACLGPYFPYLPEINDPGGSCADVETMLPASGAGYYTYGPANHRYGTENVIETIEGVAALWSARHDDILIGIGDISLVGGGRTRRHASHTLGVDVDFRPLRQDHQGAPVTIFDAAYDRNLTADLIGAFQSFGKNVPFIFFNDQSIPKVNVRDGHNNHFHVRFSEVVSCP